MIALELRWTHPFDSLGWAGAPYGLLFFTGWILAACSTVSEPLPGEQMLAAAEQQSRLERIAWPLLAAGAELCGSAVSISYGVELEDVGPEIRVKNSHPKLPGGVAGLRNGDRVLSMEHQDMRHARAIEALAIVHRLNRLHITLLELRVERSGQTHDLAIEGVPTCNYPVVLLLSNLVNAVADGKRILVTTGMMRFVRNDTELSLVVGHEIAHNALQHPDTLRLKALLKDLVSAHTGSREPGESSRPHDLEIEADYVGLYILARAGYDVTPIRDFWRRLDTAQRLSGAEQFSKSHPTTHARLAAFEQTLDEINKKRKSEIRLLPDFSTPP